jgi:hypothetical protein
MFYYLYSLPFSWQPNMEKTRRNEKGEDNSKPRIRLA